MASSRSCQHFFKLFHEYVARSCPHLNNRSQWTRPGRAYSTFSTPKHAEKEQRDKVTLSTVRQLYKSHVPISYMTAYDYPTGMLVDASGMDVCLVGDSLAMVALGHDNTNQVTMDEMLHHCKAVSRGCRTALRVGDLPFGSYQNSPQQALGNAVRMVQEGNMEAVKLEGGVHMRDTVQHIVRAGIPVLGHIGLLPQSQNMYGGYRVQGKTAKHAIQLVHDALALQEAGAFSVVLEAIPEPVAEAITQRLDIPTIGIGAGVKCSGQVLVMSDMLGVFQQFQPKFCKRYAELWKDMQTALETYNHDVKARAFPAQEHTYAMKPIELEQFREWLAKH
jgi:3-methyl-2-oxobutanoate hydroxymethyltransferase